MEDFDGEFFVKLAEIQRLLDEALEHYLTYEGHCKSGEGYVSVSFGSSWDRRRGDTGYTVNVYSYVLSPYERSHDFNNIDEALVWVRDKHAEEMSFTPAADYQEKAQAVAAEFLDALGDKITVIEISPTVGDEEEEV